ncbi:hypothetical protein [Dictyobacter aurantiacus]|uniref:HEAT repeat domain-containing protein n=1 Tax=Dictyobacter aurantiacus TaxID=1936993 RepID=A0A401ZHJ2_9CHLR|nr:hypothetical protein [Dictyobacter aurantiacus]GCE06337.1 hypothetical protein KDAU_36660 [Dictyobacter aurantiacus]
MTKYQAIEQAKMHPEAQSRGFMLLKLSNGINGSFDWRFLDEKVPKGAKVIIKYRTFRTQLGELMWSGEHTSHNKEETEWHQVVHDLEEYKHFLNVEALQEFDWMALRTPYGNNSSQFPYILCALTFSDPIVRREAIAMLGTIEYNDCISTATYPTVRFLLELVRNSAISDRAAILEVLLAVARADCYNSKPLEVIADEQFLSLEQYEAYQAYFAIRDAIPFFLALLAHSDIDIRRFSSGILGCYPERLREIWPSLEQAFKVEPNELIQVIHLFNLCNLASADFSIGISWLETTRLTHQSELVRCYATIRLAYFCRHLTPPDAIAALTEWLTTNPSVLAQNYRSVPDDDYFGNLYSDVEDALHVCEVKTSEEAD